MNTKKIALSIFVGLITTGLFVTSCKKSDDTLPAIDGYNSSDEVASSNLIAYWPFDGNATETKQNLTGVNNGASFTTGVRGQAYKGSGASNIFFNNPGTAFNNLKSYSLSVWINEAAQPVNNSTPSYIAGQGAQGIFFVYDKTGAAWNLLHLNLEPYSSTSDSLRVHAGFNNTGAPEWQGIVPEGFFPGSINKWTHLVMSYDGATSTYILYKNGLSVPVSSAWGKAAVTQIWTNGSKTTPMGYISFKNAPGGIVIGAFPQAVTPTINSNIGGPQSWSGNFQGAIDELRVYDKAITQSEVGALYNLGVAGR